MADALEIHDSMGNYVGYYNVRKNEIVDTVKKRGLAQATENAGRKGASRNPAMRMSKSEALEQKRRRDRAYRKRKRNGQ